MTAVLHQKDDDAPRREGNTALGKLTVCQSSVKIRCVSIKSYLVVLGKGE